VNLQHQIEIALLSGTTIYHALASYLESRRLPEDPERKLITIDGLTMAIIDRQDDGIAIVYDSSLGGVENNLLLDRLADCGRVVIYDRAGYGLSQSSPFPRCSSQIVTELDRLLRAAEIPPPYLLIGDSFGSYNMRLFADRFPDRVLGLVLTDGLDPRSMLNLPWQMRLLKYFFGLSFYFVSIGAALGLVRVLGNLGIFELVVPQLKQFPKQRLEYVKRSFYSAKHWQTMAREIFDLDRSGRDLELSNDLGALPIVSIKAETFLRILGIFKLGIADRVRDRIHQDLLTLSTDTSQISVDSSSHFVWIDRPDSIVAAVRTILAKVNI
jgi:pimeloyl-ACP methyl ester carboxylesterase